MTSLAERPHPRPMRLAVDGLWITIGPADSQDGYRVFVDPNLARAIALGLLRAADRAERDAAPALDELDDIVRTRFDA